MIVLPNLDWYLSISTPKQLSPRCPYASVYRCPRFYQSLSLLGAAGSTKIDPKEDNKLKESWEKTDIWPIAAEQATSVSGPGDKIKHFSHFCPEVSFDCFGFFAAELHKYADEIDIGSAHKALLREGALPDDWRWNWWHIEPMHYAECPLYSLLRLGKGRNAPKPTFPNIGLPDSITTQTISVTEADNLTAKDVEDLIYHMYKHPEIKTFEVYYQGENPHLKKAIGDFKIFGDTVEMHYYKDPDHDRSFIKAHKNTARSDWEKHLIATSPMYLKRVISLTDRQRKKMEIKENQTIWDKVIRHPVYITIALVGSIASIIGLLYVFSPGNAIDHGAKLESSPGSAVYQAGRDIVIKQQPPTANESLQNQLVQPTNTRSHSKPMGAPHLQEDLNKGNEKAMRDNKVLESRNVSLKASNDAIIKPRTTSAPLKALKSREIGPNQLVSYLDDAVTVHASYIKENGACLMTNFDNDCKFTEVGKLLPFRVGDKKYAFRVDGTSMWIRNDPTHADNIIKITILFLGND